MGFTPIETEDTFTVGDHDVSPVMAQLQRELGRVFASLDDLGRFEKKQMLGKWVGDVHASGLQTHQQALLIEAFSVRVRDLEPAEVKESAWNLCVGGLATMAGAHPGDQVLNDRLRQIAETLPMLPKLRYTNNPLVALAQCREAMRVTGYPQVVSALYLTAARQMATSLTQEAKECGRAFNLLLDQICRGRAAGDEIPMRQIGEVLGPAVEVWTSRNGGSMSTDWRAFLRDSGF